MFGRRLLLSLSIGAALIFSIGTAHAVLITPGSTVALPGTTAAAEPELAGSIIVDGLIPFSFPIASGGDVFGRVQVRIVRSSLDSTLHFYWGVRNDAQSSGPIGSLRIGGFGMSEFEANYRIDSSGTTSPSEATGFADGLNFIFATTPLAPGSDSNLFFVNTMATDFARTAVYDLTGVGTEGISDLFSTYAPVRVPEPGVLVLMFSGLGAMLLGRKTRS